MEIPDDTTYCITYYKLNLISHGNRGALVICCCAHVSVINDCGFEDVGLVCFIVGKSILALSNRKTGSHENM